MTSRNWPSALIIQDGVNTLKLEFTPKHAILKEKFDFFSGEGQNPLLDPATPMIGGYFM